MPGLACWQAIPLIIYVSICPWKVLEGSGHCKVHVLLLCLPFPLPLILCCPTPLIVSLSTELLVQCCVSPAEAVPSPKTGKIRSFLRCIVKFCFLNFVAITSPWFTAFLAKSAQGTAHSKAFIAMLPARISLLLALLNQHI